MKGRLAVSPFFGRTDVALNQPYSMKIRGLAGLTGSLSQGLVRFLYNVLMGRILGVAALGAVNSAMSLALLLSLLWPTSSGQAATRFVAQMRGEGSPEKAQAVATYLGQRMLAAAAVLGLVTVGVSLTLLRTDLGTALSAGALLIGYACWSFSRGVQYGAGQIVRAAAWDVAGAVLAVVMLVLVLALRWDAVLLLPLALSYGLYGVICWPRKSKHPLDKQLLADMNKFVSYGVLGTLSSTGLLQLSMIGAKLAGTEHEAGLYAAALSLATPATMLARTLSQVLFPAMAEAGGRGDNESLRRQTDMVTRGLAISMVAVFGCLALSSPLLLKVLYGSAFSGAANLLPVMLVAVMMTTLPVACINRLNSSGITGARRVSFTAAGGLVLAALLWVFFAPTYSVAGIAGGYLVATTGTAIGMMAMAWKLDSQAWKNLVWRLLAGIALLSVGILCNFLFTPPLWAGLAMACVFLGLWLLICLSDIKALRAGSKGS